MFCALTISAQSAKNYEPALLVMMQYAQNDFEAIIGAKQESIPDIESTAYHTKEAIGIGSEMVIKSDHSDKAFYLLTGLLSDDGISKLIHDALKIANDGVTAGKFNGTDYNEEGKSVTEIRDKDDRVLMKLISAYSDDNNPDNDTFSIMIFGKSLRESM